MRPGEVLALCPVDIADSKKGMVAHVRGTVIYEPGRGSFRQGHPKTHASVRMVPVPEFAASVIRRRLIAMTAGQSQKTIFTNGAGGVLSAHNVRRTFRELLVLAGLEDSGITPRWYRRTRATVLARGVGVDAAATHLGHTSTVITESHYIEPDRSGDFGPARALELTLRPVDPDGALLAQAETDEEETLLDELDPNGEVEAPVEVLVLLDAELGPVRSGAVDAEDVGAVDARIAVLVEVARRGERAGETGQSRVIQRDGDELSGLCERGVHAPVGEDRVVLYEVASRGDCVRRRHAVVARRDNVYKRIDLAVCVGGRGSGVATAAPTVHMVIRPAASAPIMARRIIDLLLPPSEVGRFPLSLPAARRKDDRCQGQNASRRERSLNGMPERHVHNP